MAEAWGVADLPAQPGLTLLETIDAAANGTVKGMYIMGENPAVSDPDITHVEKALDKLEFLVVQDMFLTETAKFADVVLPATSWAEKEGTFTGTGRIVQLVRKTIEPLGESLSDWQIICDLAKAMNAPDFVFSSARELFEEIRKVTPIYAGMNFARLNQLISLQWPCPDESYPGTPILHV